MTALSDDCHSKVFCTVHCCSCLRHSHDHHSAVLHATEHLPDPLLLAILPGLAGPAACCLLARASDSAALCWNHIMKLGTSAEPHDTLYAVQRGVQTDQSSFSAVNCGGCQSSGASASMCNSSTLYSMSSSSSSSALVSSQERSSHSAAAPIWHMSSGTSLFCSARICSSYGVQFSEGNDLMQGSESAQGFHRALRVVHTAGCGMPVCELDFCDWAALRAWILPNSSHSPQDNVRPTHLAKVCAA